ncbi:MAG: phosphate acyltransferase PlsX [bacterium]|nr:phosphate acyltransferase PlsX [bacterium]
MGGDNAPHEIVVGAAQAARDGIAEVILVGDRAAIEACCPERDRAGLEICDVQGVPVAMDEHAAQAARRADETSMGVAVNLVRDGKADAVVSAGNTGAFHAIALLSLGRVRGVKRPAIATVLPAPAGPVLLLDAGANVDCKPEYLLQFGLMGDAYARVVMGIAQPRVAVLSIGEEPTKGNSQTVAAYELLSAAHVRFVGNVEGRDIMNGTTDVVVTDGFVGNVVLKFGEGMMTTLFALLKERIMSSGPLGKLGALLLSRALRPLGERMNWERYGGAPLLGLQGICIVTHGRAKALAIRNSVQAAAFAVERGLVQAIADEIAEPKEKQART